MPKSKYKAVIFDFDDTLVESRLIKWAHHKHVAKKFYNIELSDEAILAHWGKPINTLVTELYQSADTLENMYSNLLSVRDEFRKVAYEGAVDVLKKLIEQKIDVCILSASNKKFLMHDLADFGFPLEAISIIQGADETDVHKPDPKVFIPTFEKLYGKGIEKSDMVYIGDSLMDMQAARGAGIDFIGVTTGLYGEEEFKNNGAKVIIKNIKEVVGKLI